MKKEINKETITRSRLRNKFFGCRPDQNKKAYNEQRNLCVKLVRSARKAHLAFLTLETLMAVTNFGN